jgi:hypothetical protein
MKPKIQTYIVNFSKLSVWFFLFLFTTFNVTANFSIEGYYQGKNIYVQSALADDGFGFCVSKVMVNGAAVPVNVRSSAFQINLDEYDLEIGEEVLIVFEHDEGCQPKLLNPEVLLPKSTFVLENLTCTPEGHITWKTKNETGKLNYLIEQYKWNKWVVVGEVSGEGSPNLTSYTYIMLPHSGENTIRLAQYDNTGNKRTTKSFSYLAKTVNEPIMNMIKTKQIIEFTADKVRVKTKYEVYDAFGNITKKGYNSIIDYSNLQPGVYHINYDNKNEKIIVR